MINNLSEKSELGPEDGMYVKQNKTNQKAIWEESISTKRLPDRSGVGHSKELLWKTTSRMSLMVHNSHS